MGIDIPMVNNKSLFGQLSLSTPSLKKEVEAWVVNTLKVKMIRKLDNLLERQGKANARKLFLVSLFTVSELGKRVEEPALEIKTMFNKELVKTLEEKSTPQR